MTKGSLEQYKWAAIEVKRGSFSEDVTDKLFIKSHKNYCCGNKQLAEIL